MSRIEGAWSEGKVLRLNMITDINEAYAKKLNIITTPTFILFDAAGNEQERWIQEAPPLDDLPSN